MVREMSLGDALHSVVSLVVEFMQSDSCLLYLLQDQELVLCASNNPQPDTIGNVRLKLGEGLTGWVARERRLLSISREAYLDPRFKLFTDLPEDTFEAFLSAPIFVRNRVAGRYQRAASRSACAYRRRDGIADHGRRNGRFAGGFGGHRFGDACQGRSARSGDGPCATRVVMFPRASSPVQPLLALGSVIGCLRAARVRAIREWRAVLEICRPEAERAALEAAVFLR